MNSKERMAKALAAARLRRNFNGTYQLQIKEAIAAYLGNGAIVSPDDLSELKDWAEVCDHIDHHGYCQTHGLGDTDEDELCGIGRLIVSLKEVER